MNFLELVAQVISDTGRPDLGLLTDGGDGQIPAAIFAATLRVHQSEFYWRDIIASNVIFNSCAWIQTLDIKSIPRFRAISYFRKWDPTFQSEQINPTVLPPLFNGTSIVNIELALKDLEVVDLGRGGIFDRYGSEKQDVCYAAGDVIYMKSSTAFQYGKLGYYSRPLLDISNNGAGYTSWIAEHHPWVIVYAADAAIFSVTGDLDRARELVRPATYGPKADPGGLYTQEKAALDMNNIEAVGR